MGRFSLTHQIDALGILRELRDHDMSGNGGEGAPWPGETLEPRLRTIAERARENCVSRLLEILTQLISVEEDFLRNISFENNLLKRKDSIDLKNICLRMAVSEAGSRSCRDLIELRDCLRLIIGNLLTYARDENNLSSSIIHRLVELLSSLPEI